MKGSDDEVGKKTDERFVSKKSEVERQRLISTVI